MPTPHDSCTDKPKTIFLDPDGQGAQIGYQLYPHVCLPLSLEMPIDIEEICIREEHKEPPQNHFWNSVATLPPAEIREWVATRFRPPKPRIPDPSQTSMPAVTRGNARQPLQSMKFEATKADDPAYARLDLHERALPADDELIDEIVANIKSGKRPVFERTVAQDERVGYEEQPKEPIPTLTLLLHFRMCIFKGDYGLGEVVSTYSLFPGEKVELSIRTFEHDEVSASKSESVFDSFSTSSADSFQRTITQSLARDSKSATSTDWKVGGSIKLSFPIKAVKAEIEVHGSYSKSVSDSISESMSSLDSSVASHSSEANSARNVNVSTSSSSTSINETEEKTLRKIENINWSRTLNFIFRQMNQEYVIITYLDRVSFSFGNGYVTQVCGLDKVESMLEDIVPENKAGRECAEKLLAAIRMELCNVFDYEGKNHSFIECKEFKPTDCCDKKNVGEPRTIIRKKPGLQMEYAGHSVPGIITSVNRIVMKTPGIFTEAVLGQGEALDCYNARLQESAAWNAELSNIEKSQLSEIIGSQADPQARLDASVRLRQAECCPPKEDSD